MAHLYAGAALAAVPAERPLTLSVSSVYSVSSSPSTLTIVPTADDIFGDHLTEWQPILVTVIANHNWSLSISGQAWTGGGGDKPVGDLKWRYASTEHDMTTGGVQITTGTPTDWDGNPPGPIAVDIAVAVDIEDEPDTYGNIITFTIASS